MVQRARWLSYSSGFTILRSSFILARSLRKHTRLKKVLRSFQTPTPNGRIPPPYLEQSQRNLTGILWAGRLIKKTSGFLHKSIGSPIRYTIVAPPPVKPKEKAPGSGPSCWDWPCITSIQPQEKQAAEQNQPAGSAYPPGWLSFCSNPVKKNAKKNYLERALAGIK